MHATSTPCGLSALLCLLSAATADSFVTVVANEVEVGAAVHRFRAFLRIRLQRGCLQSRRPME